jgi:hypothetical protein
VPQESSAEEEYALEQLVLKGLVKKVAAVPLHGSSTQNGRDSLADDPDNNSYLLAFGLLRRWVLLEQPHAAINPMAG